MKIAIVGAGPTAAALMESLFRARDTISSNARLDVSVFDPSPHAWCGGAFAPDRSEALANTYTSTMSVRNWEPEHVDAWLEAKGYSEFTGHNFAPRSLLGRYFQDSARLTAARMEQFAFVAERVSSVTVLGATVRVDTPTQYGFFDYVVLCTGGAMTSDPCILEGQDNFYITPYPLEQTLRDIKRDDDIGIIGSGLTAIDLVIALKADGHRGRVTLMSRHGLLPAVRRSPHEYELQYFTVENIERIASTRSSISLHDVIKLVDKDLTRAGSSINAFANEISPTNWGLDRLREQLARVNDGEIAYSIVIKMLPAAFQDTWYFLDRADKALITSFQHVYQSLCCPMRRERAAEILEFADAGQFHVMRGFEQMTTTAGGRFVATCCGSPPHYFDKVFSATSKPNAVHPMAEPLIRGLLQSGHAVRHPLGGLDIERTTSALMDAYDCPQPHLYAVGPMTSGAFHFLNGYAVLRQRTVHIADSIVRHYESTTRPALCTAQRTFVRA